MLPEFLHYMPSDWSAISKKTEKPFFWEILSTCAPEYVEQLLIDCREQRIGDAAQRNGNN